MFDYGDAMRKLSRLEGEGYGKTKRFLTDFLRDPDFLRWVYTPDNDHPTSPKQFNDLQNLLLTSKNLRAISEGFEDIDYEADRAVATYLNALAESAVDVYNKQHEALERKSAERTISRSDVRAMEDKLDVYRKDIERLAKTARRIIKRHVKRLVSDTHLSKNMCRLGFWCVPGPKYLSRNRIGVFLKELLNRIYEECATNGFANYTTHGRGPWEIYFRYIFGTPNLSNVATFILLEGVNSIDRYKGTAGMSYVRDCWDSLTEFALYILEESPDQVRDQMIELYLKRIDRQFRNRKVDLRVDILKLPDTFRRLSKTVEKYADRIQEIVNRAQNSVYTKPDEI